MIATRHEDQVTVNEIVDLRAEKYGVQRLAVSIGLFSEEASEEAVALRLDPCPGA